MDETTSAVSPLVNNILIFPNPNNGVFSVRGMPERAKIVLVDPSGQMVEPLKIQSNDAYGWFDAGKVAAGVYYAVDKTSGRIMGRVVIVSP